jgi:hypothetical protein
MGRKQGQQADPKYTIAPKLQNLPLKPVAEGEHYLFINSLTILIEV